jgi:hypothetical protein
MKATSARGLARSRGRAERLMRSAAVTEGKRQRRSDTNQIFAKPWRLLLAARAEAKFWTPYKLCSANALFYSGGQPQKKFFILSAYQKSHKRQQLDGCAK